MMFWIIATFFAYFAKGVVGFANTLVFNSVMGFAAESAAITPTEIFLSYPANLIVAFKERKNINWKLSLTMAAMIVIGGIPGAIFLKNANGNLVKMICGIIIMLLGIEMFLRERSSAKFKNTRLGMTVFGLTCGVMCGAYGVGALMGAYFSRVAGDTHEFKANLNTVFVIENTFRMINYIVIGLITFESFKRAIALLPVMVIGLLLGMLVSKHIDEKRAKHIVILVLIVSGAVLTITNI